MSVATGLTGHHVVSALSCVCRYWTEGVPVLLFTSLPMTLLGVWLPHGGWWKRAPFLLSLWELLFHSSLSHKEHRFIFPIVPIASIYAGKSKLNNYSCIHQCVVILSMYYNVLIFIYYIIGYCVCWTITLIRSRGILVVMD